MSDELQQKFDAAIREHMPGMVGDELRAILAEHEEQKKWKETAEGKIRHLEKIRNDQNDKLSRHESLDKRRAELDTKEQELKEREFNLKVALLEEQLRAEKTLSSNLVQFMLGLSRNTIYRRTFMGDVPVGTSPPADGYGSSDQYAPRKNGPVVASGVSQETTEEPE